MDSRQKVKLLLLFKLLVLKQRIHANREEYRLTRTKAMKWRRRAKEKACAVAMICSTLPSDRIWKIPRNQQWWEECVPAMDEVSWRENFRVSRETFNFLCAALPEMKRNNTHLRRCISTEKRVAIALYTLASSSEYRTISHLFGVGKSTVCKIVIDFCNAVINNLMSTAIQFPQTKNEIDLKIRDFYEIWNFPQCFGSIDGTHIPISPPKKDCIDYYNYKGWYSVVLLAVSDAKYMFTYINVGSPGRNNDAHIFKNSNSLLTCLQNINSLELGERIGGEVVPPLIIGDSAFPLQPTLMKPFPSKTEDEMEKTFNFRLSRARRVVENAFGRLKARFRRLSKRMDNRIDISKRIIKTCCILHNLCEKRDDPIEKTWLNEINQSDSSSERICVIGINNTKAISIRNAIARSFRDED
ncbi:uncharacterized protein [Centruroides vittatus]|uniref:uncharacterized protein n=1 Tax=Centruroides vittatus TaxID=120091 RepID=UPI0035108A62